jgi:hypothetical protein
MNQHSQKHPQRHGHNHGQHGHDHAQQKSRWRPHRDWRFWTVVVMLVAMVIYILTMDESLDPGGDGREVPAAPADAL